MTVADRRHSVGPARVGWSSWLISLSLALVLAPLYFAAMQPTVHGGDVFFYAKGLRDPGFVHPLHPGYLVLARGLDWLLQQAQQVRPLAMTVLQCLSAAGAALAVLGFHRAALALRGDARQALLLAVVTATCPALLFFATIGEVHAAFAAPMSFAWWAAIAWSRRPRLGTAVLCGLLSGCATLCHATGHLLLPLLAGAVLWRRWNLATPSMPRQVLCFAATHVAVWSLGFFALRASGKAPTGDPATFLLDSLSRADAVAAWPATLWTEWVLAFLPLSVLCAAALVQPGRRLPVALLWSAVFAYVTVTAVLVQGAVDEVGAYSLPLLFPAAVVAIDTVPARRWWWLGLLTLACGLALRARPTVEPPDHTFGRAAAAYAAVHPTTFLVGDLPEHDGALWADPDLHCVLGYREFLRLRASFGDRAATAFGEDELLAWLHLQASEAHAKGRDLVVTDRAAAWIGERVPAFRAAWQRFVGAPSVARLPTDTGIEGFVVAR